MKQVVLVFMLLGTMAKAGVSTSGGGYAVVCRDQEKTIISAELLDLVEGRIRYGFQMMTASGSAIVDYGKSVDNTYHLQMDRGCDVVGCLDSTKNYSNFLNIIDWVPNQKHLEVVLDVGDVSEIVESLRPGCDIEQIANFNDTITRVQVAKDVWLKLDSLSQAALVQHELWYRHSRNFYLLPEVDSENSRLSTAIVFSQGIPSVMNGIPTDAKNKSIFHDPNRAKNSRYDSTTYSLFFIEQSDEDLKTVYRRQFQHIGGRAVLTKTYVDIPQGVDFFQVYPLQSQQFKGWYVRIEPDFENLAFSGPIARLYNDKDFVVTDLR